VACRQEVCAQAHASDQYVLSQSVIVYFCFVCVLVGFVHRDVLCHSE
jgi:hypothetical protein